jgi:hypothetical protein
MQKAATSHSQTKLIVACVSAAESERGLRESPNVALQLSGALVKIRIS